jgi:formylglycine-generating enzyme required for sulfatase activity
MLAALLAAVLGAAHAQQGAGVPANMVRVEGGTFNMGSANGEDREKPVHQVTVKGFYMGKYEVTQKEWREVMGTTIAQQRDAAQRDSVEIALYFGSPKPQDLVLKGEGDNYPMYFVSWLEAVEYCNRRSQKEGLTPCYRSSGGVISCDFTANGYRLPTEAEWEYAAKGGNQAFLEYEYAGSNNADAAGWYSENSGRITHPVGTKSANSLGIYDLSGNVDEWCWDWYGNYTSGTQRDPTGPSDGVFRIHRGGSWFDDAQRLGSAKRGFLASKGRSFYTGFRVVRSQ